MRRLVVINGHPDPRRQRFCAALTAAYVRGGVAGGWRAQSFAVGELALSSLQRLAQGEAPDAAAGAILDAIERAERLAIIYPLWFDKPPEPLTTLMSRVAARKAHIVVTMDMPAFAYRSLLRDSETPSMLALADIVADEPVLIGGVSTITLEQRRGWLRRLRHYGERTWLGSAVEPSRVQAFTRMLDRTVFQLWG